MTKLELAIAAIKEIDELDAQGAADLIATVEMFFTNKSLESDAIVDCVMKLEAVADHAKMVAGAENQANINYINRQDSALFQAHPGFGEAFDALDSLRIRGAI